MAKDEEAGAEKGYHHASWEKEGILFPYDHSAIDPLLRASLQEIYGESLSLLGRISHLR